MDVFATRALCLRVVVYSGGQFKGSPNAMTRIVSIAFNILQDMIFC